MISSSELRRRYPEAFDVNPALYWCDLLATAAVGWGAFALAGSMPPGIPGLLAFAVAVLALYRAALFIHEIAHLRRSALPGFEVVWNVIAGFPLCVPSLMYVGPHMEHHRASTYGTVLDPEYDSIAHWRPGRIVLSSLTMLAVPLLLLIRFALLGTIGRLIPPLRRWTVESASTLGIRPSYKRKPPRGRDRWRWGLQEAATGAFTWTAIVATATGLVSWHWALLWYAVTASILVLNHLRTLAAHRYENDGGRMDAVSQLRDSVNVGGAATALLAPVGLRFHALHHLAPALPYHSMGRVHRALSAELPAGSAYHEAASPGVPSAVRQLFRRAAGREPFALPDARPVLDD